MAITLRWNINTDPLKNGRHDIYTLGEGVDDGTVSRARFRRWVMDNKGNVECLIEVSVFGKHPMIPQLFSVV